MHREGSKGLGATQGRIKLLRNRLFAQVGIGFIISFRIGNIQINSMLVQCWPAVYDVGPTLNHH